jgi:hypothetical protein
MQYSGDCAHVLENHDSMVTACAFSGDSSLLTTGITKNNGSKNSDVFVHSIQLFCTLLSLT